MATSNQESLKMLDKMFNEVLVQTGKHLNAARKDGTRSLAGASNSIHAKTSDSLTAYHYALNDLESEITRAKAVLLRDLEKLRSARIPAPAPAPVSAPAPQPVAPPAPMMELPSSAAHTMSTPSFAPKREGKTVAPFPDMGMGMSADVVDLTSSDKKASPRVPASAIKPPVRPNPTIKNDMKPSPKQVSKPMPKSTPSKVTPVPVPQIPRLQPSQPSTVGPTAASHPQPAVPPSQPIKPAQTSQDSSLGPILSLSATNAGGDTIAATGGNGLNFTDMQFSLAPPNNDTQGAPPAPMSEFDLTSFTAPRGNNEAQANDNLAPGKNGVAAATATQASKQEDKPDNNLDDLFNLGDSNDGTDAMFDLGGGSVNDSTFDDMMYFDNKDSDMGQFDEAYFGLS
ncbi:hypothetical protein F4779DRAFT_44374 [Xylariaceae sp. FL0662B]|nr:hypothetical protein F4779DRAFT_44374 [Xylariaceae sp. FL0662B]